MLISERTSACVTVLKRRNERRNSSWM